VFSETCQRLSDEVSEGTLRRLTVERLRTRDVLGRRVHFLCQQAPMSYLIGAFAVATLERSGELWVYVRRNAENGEGPFAFRIFVSESSAVMGRRRWGARGERGVG
jgi:hypothetical protein